MKRWEVYDALLLFREPLERGHAVCFGWIPIHCGIRSNDVTIKEIKCAHCRHIWAHIHYLR